jgi:hypothetical protein
MVVAGQALIRTTLFYQAGAFGIDELYPESGLSSYHQIQFMIVKLYCSLVGLKETI